jgi:8-oxo-dGTP pyrophosphatase MutT (NUDIX family)
MSDRLNERHLAGRHRLTSRILVFDERDRVLLFLTKGFVPTQRTRWITPGGGVEPGESHAEAAKRELFEETGLVRDDLGAPMWAHSFTVDYTGGDHDTGYAEYFLLRTTTFEPSYEHWTPGEQTDVLEIRWWSLAELISTEEPFEPAELVSLIRSQLPSC